MEWSEFYRLYSFKHPSSFARFATEYLGNDLVDLGCGDGRDYRYFQTIFDNVNGIDQIYGDDEAVENYIKKHKSPKYVYTRFFWHSIDRELQLKILKWVKSYIFIEARTTEDKPKNVYGPHKRNLVNVPQLIKDLKKCNFQILHLHEGKGLSKHKGEDPHLVRIIAKKYE